MKSVIAFDVSMGTATWSSMMPEGMSNMAEHFLKRWESNRGTDETGQYRAQYCV